MYYLEKALIQPKQTKDYVTQAKIYIDYGNFYVFRNKNDSAIFYYLQADAMARNTKDYATIGVVNNNIGIIKARQEDYESALSYYMESLSSYERLDKTPAIESKQNSLNLNISATYHNLNNYTKANYYADKVLLISKAGMDTSLYSSALSTKGLIALKSGNNRNAVDYSLNALMYVQKSDEEYFPLLYNLVNGYAAMEIYDSSLYYNKHALNAAENHKNDRYKISFLQTIHETYHAMQNYKAAYQFLLNLYEIKNNETSLKRLKIASSLEQKYQNKKKTLEIQELKYQSALKSLNFYSMLVLILLVTGAGYFIFKRRIYRQKLEIAKQKEKNARSVLMGQEEERKRISVDLHDSIGATLATIRMRMDAYTEKQPSETLNTLKNEIDSACKELRTIAHDLSPYKIEQEGLLFSLESLVETLNQSQQTAFKIAMDINENRLSILQKSIVYRIIQELTTNVCKHAEAATAGIYAEMDQKTLSIQLSDNGKGLVKGDEKNGIGLENIKSRVSYLNGTFEIISQPEYGTLFTLSIPLLEIKSTD